MPIGFGSFYFLPGRFLSLLFETVGKYDNRMAVKKTEYPIDIGTMLDSALPDFRSPDQFLEIGGRDHLHLFQQAKHPDHFLRRFAGQCIKKILDGTFPVYCTIEDNRSVHDDKLTRTLTYVKMII
jgi:hypothetical protein